MATVDKFLRGYELQEDNEFGQKAGDWLAGYVLKRTMYARLDHVTGVDGQSGRGVQRSQRLGRTLQGAIRA